MAVTWVQRRQEGWKVPVVVPSLQVPLQTYDSMSLSIRIRKPQNVTNLPL